MDSGRGVGNGAVSGAGVVIVGASMAGLRAAEAVRKAGYPGPVVLIGEEPAMPYNRPPLTKEALRGTPAADVAGAAEALALRVARVARDVTWRLGEPVVAADLVGHTVTLAGGEQLSWDGLVIATGLRSRRLALPGPGGGLVDGTVGDLVEGPASGRHAVRTVQDAVRLRAELVPGARLVVIGAGFIGCEVAATARALGVEVTVVAPERVPMERPLGELLGGALQRRHEAHGVRFRLGRLPVAFESRASESSAFESRASESRISEGAASEGAASEGAGGGRVSGVRLDDGSTLDADVVVEAVGCIPDLGWLAGSGLDSSGPNGSGPNGSGSEGWGIDVSDGVLCDGELRARTTSGQVLPDVVACGDVARFPNPLFDDVPRRVEHWRMATDTGRRAGLTLAQYLARSVARSVARSTAGPTAGPTAALPDEAAAGAPFAPVPSFWSDQYDVTIQSFGSPELGPDVRILEGDPDAEVAVGYHRDGVLVGVVMLGLDGRQLEYRDRIVSARAATA